MVQAIINLGKMEDRILTIVKGKYGLKNKSDAVNVVIDYYAENLLEPELRPEFVEKIKKIEKEKIIRVGSFQDFKKKYGAE